MWKRLTGAASTAMDWNDGGRPYTVRSCGGNEVIGFALHRIIREFWNGNRHLTRPALQAALQSGIDVGDGCGLHRLTADGPAPSTMECSIPNAPARFTMTIRPRSRNRPRGSTVPPSEPATPPAGYREPGSRPIEAAPAGGDADGLGQEVADPERRRTRRALQSGGSAGGVRSRPGPAIAWWLVEAVTSPNLGVPVALSSENPMKAGEQLAAAAVTNRLIPSDEELEQPDREVDRVIAFVSPAAGIPRWLAGRSRPSPTAWACQSCSRWSTRCSDRRPGRAVATEVAVAGRIPTRRLALLKLAVGAIAEHPPDNQALGRGKRRGGPFTVRGSKRGTG